MNTLIRLTLGALLTLATTQAAFADSNTPLKPPRVYTGIYQPKGSLTKASSFAPRPGGTRRRVYGTPIQPPIFKMQPQKPTPSAPPKHP